MAINVNGKQVATTDNGFLEDIQDWSEDVAREMAAADKLELEQRHWDLINHLRDEYINNGGNQPNTRSLVKAMAASWGDKAVNAKTLYDLFPLDPSKQGGRIAGLPESRRKGGY